MIAALAQELDGLPPALKERLAAHRFDPALLLALAERLATNDTDNRIREPIAPPLPEDIRDLPAPSSEKYKAYEARGLELLSNGRAAMIVLAGGMATRMGGVVKALEEAVAGKTFLDLRLAEQQAIERRTGRRVPLWLMTSAATDGKIREYLHGRLDGETLAVFPQRLGLRLTPEGRLFRDAHGNASDHAPGHGDLVDAVRDSSLIGRFLARGGQVVTVANLDNLGATLDPVLLGMHVSSGRAVTCEVVDKLGSDRGGIPVRVGKRTVVLEEFRLPEGFDASSVRVFNTNTFHLNARAIAETHIPWTYFVVRKTVDGRPAIQFERLLNELTSYMDTNYCRVPRTGAESRFLPVKDREELAARRKEIERVAYARGMLP